MYFMKLKKQNKPLYCMQLKLLLWPLQDISWQPKKKADQSPQTET